MSQLSFEYLPSIDHPLWQFSQQLYSQLEVQKTCLQLQIPLHMNLNIIFFACWFAATGRGQLQKTDVCLIHQVLQAWHTEISLPLREIRKLTTEHISHPVAHKMKREIASCELTAAKAEQTLLLDAFPYAQAGSRTVLQQVQDAYANLINYCKHLHGKPLPEMKQPTQTLLQHVFPHLSEASIDQICNQRR